MSDDLHESFLNATLEYSHAILWFILPNSRKASMVSDAWGVWIRVRGLVPLFQTKRNADTEGRREHIKIQASLRKDNIKLICWSDTLHSKFLTRKENRGRKCWTDVFRGASLSERFSMYSCSRVVWWISRNHNKDAATIHLDTKMGSVGSLDRTFAGG